MEGNDLGSFWSAKIVVVCEPTLFIPLPQSKVQRFFKRRGATNDEIGARYEMNRAMVQFIVGMKKIRNMPTEVWTFLPRADADVLAARLELVAGDAIVGWQVWQSELDAALGVRVDSAIHTVYDADADRVDRLWQLRGHRVLIGGAPYQ